MNSNHDAPHDHDLPPQTAPDSISMHLSGFQDEEYANEIANTVAYVVRELSRYIDAERLDGITIAFDYDQALANLDRGVSGLHQLTRTKDDTGSGVAMAPAVLRDGVIKSHIVIQSEFAIRLTSDDKKVAQQSIGLLAHELAHVQDNKYNDLAFPNTILKEKFVGMDGILYEIAGVCWSEYIATRLSAPFNEHSVDAYEELFTTSTTNCIQLVNNEIIKYRRHGDISRLLNCARLHYGNLLKYTAYIIGHRNGMNDSIQDVSPQLANLINKFNLREIVNKLETALKNMHSTYGEWSDPSVWTELKDVCWECLSNGGIILRTTDSNELYVDVPFTPETMP